MNVPLSINMILHGCLLLLLLNCVRTAQYNYDYGVGNSVTELDERYSFWPSVLNAATLMRLHKRDTQGQVALGHSEGGVVDTMKAPAIVSPPVQSPQPAQTDVKTIAKSEPPVPGNTTETVVTQAVNNNETSTNTTSPVKMVHPPLNLGHPGVLMRGLIVFGGFLLLAVAYFIFYRRKSNKNDTSNVTLSDNVQFRYGVLQSEDRRDNLESSRIPLTMESDEEDDEDLEIFDLEQKKKSLSYVNLQTNDEDIVFSNSTGNSREDDKDNLLLDIEDGPSDTLINWTNNGNKSIL